MAPEDKSPIDRESNVPLFRQVGDRLVAEITDGTFRDKTQLPSVKGLARQYSVSLGTMQRVLRDLARQGLVKGVRGSGIFITRNAPGEPDSEELRLTYISDMFNDAEIPCVRERFKEIAPACRLTLSDGAADVITMHGDDIPALAPDLVDVTHLVEQVYGRDANDRRLFSPLHVAGRHLMLPTLLFTTTVICNVDLFEAAGIPVPEPGWTWDDFRRAATAMTHPEREQYGFCPSHDLGMVLHAAIWQNGGRVFSSDGARCLIDEAPALDFAALLRELRPLTPPNAGYDDSGNTRHLALFARGQVAMTIGGIWFPWRLRREEPRVRWTAVPLPRGEQETGVLHSLGFGIRKDSPVQATATQFLRIAGGWEKWPDKIEHRYGLRLHKDLARADAIGAAYEYMATHSRTPLSDVAPGARSRRHHAALRLLESPVRRALTSDEPVRSIMMETRRNIELILAENGPLMGLGLPDENGPH